VKTLSGGNQQKVLLAKWMGASPRVLVLHEPTQAVDVGARRDILLAVTRAAARGIAVVLVSGEPADLVAVCDRVLVADPRHGLTEVQVSTADDLLVHIYRQHPDEKVGTSHA
jgi:ribose transport system ATP-binding protein